jgi:hypothetical protein
MENEMQRLLVCSFSLDVCLDWGLYENVSDECRGVLTGEQCSPLHFHVIQNNL